MDLLPLSDSAALVYLKDEAAALRFAAAVRMLNEKWLVDVVQAYSSVAVFFDLKQTRFAEVAERLRPVALDKTRDKGDLKGKVHRIPCCYDSAPDLERVAEQTGLNAEEVIRLHAGTEYTVCAIGFCPGFPYLGYLPAKLCGVPRLPAPRLRVEAGSIGLTGRQTGIYTEPRPGGWNLIGRTPLELVNVEDGYFPLRTGDRVRFERIVEQEFQRLREERLLVY